MALATTLVHNAYSAWKAATTTMGSRQRVATTVFKKNQNLLGSFNARDLKDTCVWTSQHLSVCVPLSHASCRNKIQTMSAIPFQIKVVVSISTLATCNVQDWPLDKSVNSLSIYQCHKHNSTQEIHQMAFYHHDGQICMESQNLHQTPYVVGAVDGISHTDHRTPVACC